jgi:hypothetical protein
MVVSRSSFVVRDECVRTTFAADHRLTTIDQRKGYNIRVNSPVPPKPAADHEHQDNKHQHRHSIYAAEATGLLLMAVLLLVLTIIRYWRYIPWNAR